MKNSFKIILAVLPAILILQTGCKKNTNSPANNGSNLSGTLVFETSDEVCTTVMGSGTSSSLFRGKDPSWTPDGRIIFDIWGEFTTNDHELIILSNTTGSNMQTLLDLNQPNSAIYAAPKMSRDGKYFSFNYYKASTLTYVGTLIYSVSGTYIGGVNNLWDASWAPDGSLVGAGTVSDVGGFSPRTTAAAGLYKVSADFKTVTAIGSGLNQPMYPSVSPDGSKIAFIMNSHVWVINMDGTGLSQVTQGPNYEICPTWSPDGKNIAAVSYGDIGIISGQAICVVPSTTLTTVSPDANIFLKDNSQNTGIIIPTGEINWH